MINKIEYDLNYRIKRVKHTKKIQIDFVPNQRHEDFAKLQSEIFEVQSKWNNIRLLQDEINDLIISLAFKPDI